MQLFTILWNISFTIAWLRIQSLGLILSLNWGSVLTRSSWPQTVFPMSLSNTMLKKQLRHKLYLQRRVCDSRGGGRKKVLSVNETGKQNQEERKWKEKAGNEQRQVRAETLRDAKTDRQEFYGKILTGAKSCMFNQHKTEIMIWFSTIINWQRLWFN